MTKRVLIADDEPNIVASLEFLMQQAGYEVRTAADGATALALIGITDTYVVRRESHA